MGLSAFICLWWAAVGAPGPIGHGQRVAVVVAQYRDGPDVQVTADEWCRLLNRFANAYYELASGGAVSFEFVPVGGVLGLPNDVPPEAGENWDVPGPLGTAMAGTNNWSYQVFDELPTAVAFGDGEIDWDETPYLLLYTARRGRAVATGAGWRVLNPRTNRFVQVSGAVIPELRGDDTRAFDPATALTTPERVNDGDAAGEVLRKVVANGAGGAPVLTTLHELGHLLGQSDLYNEYRQPDQDDFVEQWSLMGAQILQHMDSYTRLRFGWLPAQRVVTIGPPLLNDVNRTIELARPHESRGAPAEVAELVRLSFGPVAPNGEPIGLFRGLHLEAREPHSSTPENLDTWLRNVVVDRDSGGRGDYADGVLISLVTERRPAGPFIVEPQATGRRLADGVWSPGRRYRRDSAWIQVEAQPVQNGRRPVRVRWRRVEKPDLFLDPGTPLGESPDIWIDSPANGFGTFRFGNRPGDTVPDQCGDFPFINLTVPWVQLFPGGPRVPGPPEVGRVPHRLQIRVRNRGNVDAQQVDGHCLVIERPSLIDFDWEHPNRLLGLGDDRSFRIANVPAGGQVIQTIDGFEPKGAPFTIIAWLDPLYLGGGQDDLNPLNQLAGEAIVSYQTSQGSPYAPVTVPLEVINLDGRQRKLIFAATPDRLPRDWEVRQQRTHQALAPLETARFELSLRPPESLKPGTLTRPTLVGWVDYGDSFIRLGELPVHVETTVRTTTSLAVKLDGTQALFTGRVSARRPGLGVVISVTSSNGAVLYAGAGTGAFEVVRTARDGSFSARLAYNSKLSYQAVASFAGEPGLQASSSPPVGYGAPLPDSSLRPPVLRPRR